MLHSYLNSVLQTLIIMGTLAEYSMASPPDSLRFEIDVPSSAREGEPVPITLRVSNDGSQPIELHLRGRTIAFDIIVAGEDGEVVWRRLEGQTVPAILQVIDLAPGRSLELRDIWSQETNAGEQVGPGLYRVNGALPTGSLRALETPARPLRILPP
jgi:hypothetical protein